MGNTPTKLLVNSIFFVLSCKNSLCSWVVRIHLPSSNIVSRSKGTTATMLVASMSDRLIFAVQLLIFPCSHRRQWTVSTCTTFFLTFFELLNFKKIQIFLYFRCQTSPSEEVYVFQSLLQASYLGQKRRVVLVHVMKVTFWPSYFFDPEGKCERTQKGSLLKYFKTVYAIFCIGVLKLVFIKTNLYIFCIFAWPAT